MINNLTVTEPKIFFKYATGAFKHYLSKIFVLSAKELSEIGQIFTVNFRQDGKDYIFMASVCMEDLVIKDEFNANVNGLSYKFKQELVYDRNIIPLFFEEEGNFYCFNLAREIRIFEVEEVNEEENSLFSSLVNNYKDILKKITKGHKDYEGLITSKSCVSLKTTRFINYKQYSLLKNVIELEEKLESEYEKFNEQALLK